MRGPGVGHHVPHDAEDDAHREDDEGRPLDCRLPGPHSPGKFSVVTSQYSNSGYFIAYIF